MKRGTISLRRRHLVLGGLGGVLAAPGYALQYSAPAPANIDAGGSGGTEKLLVSGRILGADGKPLAGALVEMWRADARGDYSGVTRGKTDNPNGPLRASLITDADGRYFFHTIMPGEYPGRLRHIHYRVSHKGHATLVTQLYFNRELGAPEPLVVTTTRDEAGLMRASFEVTLMVG